MIAGDAQKFFCSFAQLVLYAAPRMISTEVSLVVKPSRGQYLNPILFADYSDPDVIRVNDDYYLVSSSFNHVPALPVLHSRDLIHWQIIGHALQRLPSPRYNLVQHGNGVWAPSLRFHQNRYWIFYGDPDLGVFMLRSENPAGPWNPPRLVHQAKGWIDPCPLWDDDGRAYLVHAWAKTRAGFNSLLTVHQMSPDGEKLLDAGVTVFDGHENHPIIEGPKFYQRDGWYYLFAPAGGVATGWQPVLRSRSVYGPYEDRIVLKQGNTPVNGPHQGGWVELANGESWFVHFQDRGPYGRILHLQPLRWENGWPFIGNDQDGDGIGEPVASCAVPGTDKASPELCIPTTDEFTSNQLGLQWQWQANPDAAWYDLSSRPGFLRLNAIPPPGRLANLWLLPNILAQKFPAEQFAVKACLSFHSSTFGDRAGMIVLGSDYACLSLHQRQGGVMLELAFCSNADQDGEETIVAAVPLTQAEVFLKVRVHTGGRCTFAYSLDDLFYMPLAGTFIAAPGKWVGAKIGLYALAAAPRPFAGVAPLPRGASNESTGWADFDFIRFHCGL